MKKFFLCIFLLSFTLLIIGCSQKDEGTTQTEEEETEIIIGADESDSAGSIESADDVYEEITTTEKIVEKKFLNTPIFLNVTSETQIYLPSKVEQYAIVWKVDGNYFSVNNQTIKAIKDGQAVVTATVSNDKYYYTEVFTFIIKNKKIIESKQNGLNFYYHFITDANKIGSSYTPSMIVFHNTGNTAPALNEVKYLASTSNTSSTSFHYAVDETGVYQAIPTTKFAHHAGNYPINQKSVGVEIAKSMISDSKIKDKAIENAIMLIALLMYYYDITISKVITHQDASGKYCPHDILDRYGLERFYNELRANAKYLDNKVAID